MLGVLLALLGGMLGLAGGGGSSSKAAVPDTPTSTTPSAPVGLPADDTADDTGEDTGKDTGGDPGNDVFVTDDGPDPAPAPAPTPTPAPATAPDIVTPVTDTPVTGGFGGGGMDEDDGHGSFGGHGGGTVDVVVDTGGTDDTDGGDMGGMDDHGGHGDGGMVDDGHGGHGGVGMGTLPTTPAEIAAFVAEVRSGTDTHVHDHDSPMATEHMQAMALVSPAEASHIAIGHGSWFDPDNWHNGEVPGDDANVVIPEGVYMEYDEQSDARIFTVRVDGHLEFASDTDSKMVVDTFVVAPDGQLTIGTEEAPIADDVNVEIVIANNGQIDTDWDPALLSRGLISHGKTEIYGQMKDSHEKVTEDPMAGDTSITFDGIPEGWQVGDKIVIAGTSFDGYKYENSAKARVYNEPEDEVRIITKIAGDEVHFEEPLEHDHDTPRADLKTSVANYSRNVTVRSEDGDESEVFERGHVMMMHSDDVDIRYAAFEHLGRTDKSEDLFEGSSDSTSFDSNVAGRYGLHLHRAGVDDQANPAYLEGNAVYGSPGWGIVHHDSHAVINNNATYDTFGAGYVAETGNETGSWTDNIAIDAQGTDWSGAKGLNEAGGPNFGVSGDGFWFTGRMVEAADNVAASVNHGFIYFHRAPKLSFDADVFEVSEALAYSENTAVNETPILVFEDNEAFASRMGVHVIKAKPLQGHDIHSVFDGFTAWSVQTGAGLQYTAHYILKDFDVIAREGDDGTSAGQAGIGFGKNVFDITIVNPTIEGFETGINLTKEYKLAEADADEGHFYTVIDATFDGNDQDYGNLTGEDKILTGPFNLSHDTPSLDINSPLLYKEGASDGGRILEITGTKTDSLGTSDFPNGPDDFSLDKADIVSLLEENGYYTADNGKDYMVLNIYFSDGMTGDIYKQPELVEFADNVLDGSFTAYRDAKFNGEISLKELKAMTEGEATLVRDASEAEARTLEDYQQQASLATDHASHMHEGEAMMAALSTGQTPLSETMPGEETLEDHNAHQDMAMA